MRLLTRVDDVRQDDAMSTSPKAAARSSIVQGVLDSVVGYHIARARVTTHGLFVKHVGQPLDLRPVEYSLLMPCTRSARARASSPTGPRSCSTSPSTTPTPACAAPAMSWSRC